MEWIVANWQGILAAVTGVIAAASAIAALTPTPKDDAILSKIRGLIDILALNVLNAKKK